MKTIGMRIWSIVVFAAFLLQVTSGRLFKKEDKSKVLLREDTLSGIWKESVLVVCEDKIIYLIKSTLVASSSDLKVNILICKFPRRQ